MTTLFATMCGRILRRADDHGHRYEQRCTLVAGHAGPCDPGQWMDAA